MADKIYCGTGKKSNYGIKLNINLNEIPDEFINEFNGGRYVRLELFEKKEPDKYGKTHYIVIDQWKPESKRQKEEPEDERPF